VLLSDPGIQRLQVEGLQADTHERSQRSPRSSLARSFQTIGRLRKEARDEINRLIRFLDDTDNHMELEDSIDDNPHDEETDDNGEDNEDAEPAEPSLGAFEGHDDQAVAWKAGQGRTDLELDPAESGIGDRDGLDEQARH
jgi:hypothetical protein